MIKAVSSKIVAPLKIASCAAFAIALCAIFAFYMTGCSANGAGGQSSGTSDNSSDAVNAKVDELSPLDGLRIVSMKGPTSVGLAYLMQETNAGFKVVAGADEAAALLMQDDVDIACVPANLAAMLYQKTEGGIQVIDVNTLGVLNVVTSDENIGSISDLSGRTVYMTGKGTVPEYTFEGVLDAYGLTFADVDVQFRSEAAEVVALVSNDTSAIGVLPQPYATAATLKNPDLRIAVDLTEAWSQAKSAGSGELITGVTIAKKDFIATNKDNIDAFLSDAKISSAVAASNPDEIAQTVVDLGIIDNLQLAQAAIPKCNVVCYTGNKMTDALSGYLGMLYAQNPQSVGGNLPGDDFYYNADTSV